MTENHLREEIAELGKSLYDRGLAHGSAGNISVKLADGNWLLTPTNSCLGRLDPAKISKLDGNGKLINPVEVEGKWYDSWDRKGNGVLTGYNYDPDYFSAGELNTMFNKDIFGNTNSKNSYYLDLSAALDLGEGYSLTPHVGRQMIKNTPVCSYNDLSVTLGKDLGNGLSASLMAVTTNAEKTCSSYVYKSTQLGASGVVAGIKYTF